jgi:CelD/BcsL family acetyltransferase involved in cellulose biosynthesis
MLVAAAETYRVESTSCDVSSLAVIESEWSALCDESPAPQPFYRPEWIRAYLDAFEPRARLRVFTVRDETGKLCAVLPLIEEDISYLGIGARRLRAPANVHSCRFDAAIGAGNRGRAAEALWGALRDARDWDVVELRDVPEGGLFHDIMTLAARERCPVGRWLSLRTPQLSLAPGKDLEECLGPEHKEFRAKLRKKRRKLEKAAVVELREITTLDSALIERFYAMEAAGWKGRGGTAIINDGPARKFYDRIAAEAAARGYLCMYSMAAGGKDIAIHFGFRLGAGYYLPKITFDETWGEYSPGQITFEEVLGRCKSGGLALFDFLGPTAPWKEKWASSYLPHWHCSIFRRGLAGRVMRFEKFTVLHGIRGLKHRLKGTQPG